MQDGRDDSARSEGLNGAGSRGIQLINRLSTEIHSNSQSVIQSWGINPPGACIPVVYLQYIHVDKYVLSG